MAQKATVSKMETTQTAVEWLVNIVNSDCLNSTFIRPEFVKQAKEMEKNQCIKDYNAGFDDAKCNYINDAQNFVSDSVCINEGKATDDFITGPFGKPKNK